MLQYLIKVTDNTLPAVIVFSLLLSLTMLVTRKGERTFMLCGLCSGAAAALIYVALKRNTGFVVREYYDLGVLLPSLALQAVMPVALWRLFPEGRKSGTVAGVCIALLLAVQVAYFLPNLLLYPFDFAVGAESFFSTEVLCNAGGWSLGLLLMFMLGFSIYSTAGKLPRSFLFTLFFAALLVFFAKQGLETVQILVARNMAPRRPWLLSSLIFLLTHANWFAFVLMGIMTAFTGALVVRTRSDPLRSGSPAVRRKQKAEHRALYRYCLCIALCLPLSGLILTVVKAYANREAELSPPVETRAVEEKILLPLENINDGNLHRFRYKTANGTAVRFIVIKKSESAYGVGLDACDICGPTGYYQRKDQVICKLCDVVMNKATIGFPGGCNPVPLRFSILQGNMVIRAADLEAEKQRFH